MNYIKFDPFRGFEKVSRRMNQLVNEMNHGISFETGSFNPRVDISEDSKFVYVLAELPGIQKDNVKVSVNEENILSIKGEKKLGEQPENKVFLRTERKYGEFSRSFVLPENLNKEGISAKFEDGLLELSIPKIEPPQPKEFEVNIA